MVYNSYGLILCAHESFTSAEDAVSKESDIVSNRVAVHYTTKRRLVGDTDTGIALKEKIGELMQLLDAYAKLDAAEQQVEAGQTLDARSALQELRARYGI